MNEASPLGSGSLLQRGQADGGCENAEWLAAADFFYINNGLTALGVSPFPSTTVCYPVA
jgi:hypothetical protein